MFLFRKIPALIVIVISALSFLAGINAVIPKKGEKTWTYELKAADSNSTQPDLMNFDLRIERISSGVFAVSGSFTMMLDIVAGDDTEIEGGLYRSDNGVSEYKSLPLKMPRQHFYSAFNTFYKDMVMDTLKDCSDMPVFEGKFQPPLEKKVYSLNKCQFSQDGMPNHLKDGFYKITISGFGRVEWSATLTIQVEART